LASIATHFASIAPHVGRYGVMAYGVIFKHLEVDKITWGVIFLFLEGAPFKRGADGLFGGKEGRGALFLTGVENTGYFECAKCPEVPGFSLQ
jgi:hypothetical protein